LSLAPIDLGYCNDKCEISTERPINLIMLIKA